MNFYEHSSKAWYKFDIRKKQQSTQTWVVYIKGLYCLVKCDFMNLRDFYEKHNICLNYRELEQLQNEKRKALVEHEHAKLSEIDDRLKAELREWKEQLVPRKQVIF